jgi:hypothetical protein
MDTETNTTNPDPTGTVEGAAAAPGDTAAVPGTGNDENNEPQEEVPADPIAAAAKSVDDAMAAAMKSVADAVAQMSDQAAEQN